MANTQSIDALRREMWRNETFIDAIDDLYFARKGMMKVKGDEQGDNAVVQIMDDLAKNRGDTITFPLTAKMSGDGVTGDNELEGNEEAISSYSDSVAIDQWRTGVRLTGNLDEQKNSYNMRSDAKDKLAIRVAEYIERQIFFKLAGVNNTTVTDVNGNTVGGRCAWSNSPDQVPSADTAAGYGDRYLCADYSNGADSLASTDLITTQLIDRLVTKAETSEPLIRPLRINGEQYYLFFIHPWQKYDLRQDSRWAQAQREAQDRGDDNPIFTGAAGIWNGVIIHSHKYVPYLDISSAGHNFNASASGTDIAADAFRSLFCGRQAVGFANCKNPNKGWVEKTFDYKNKTGFASGILGGIQKLTFNSKDYGVIGLDTAATAQV